MARLPVSVGVIEGFYGEPWPDAERAAAAPFLAGLGFDHYIYAPKADPLLRKAWTEPFPASEAARLSSLSEAVRGAGLQFGVGLSPFELYLDWPGTLSAAFQAKIRALNDIGTDLLCILFDDMKGDVPGLARLQAEIGQEAAEISTASRIILCPTYYSDDPVLEKVFGPAPEDYLEDLGRRLDPKIDIFWTGPKVCSEAYPADHLERVARQLGRKPFLWDNYPVNDGARMSKFLHLKAFEGRPAAIAPLIAGHSANPMNEPRLSRIPLMTLSESYRQGTDYDPCAAFERACVSLAGAEIGHHLIGDIDAFQSVGREAMDETLRAALIEKYEGFESDPFAREAAAFLRGEYVFDPACLTD